MKTSNSEKLSIIVPVHNEVETIEKFISSILQCYSNIEVLIGDDASSDGTQEIIKKYESDSRIKVLYLGKNEGAGAVRNRLLEIADGDYIAIQDADDPPVQERFLKQIQYLEDNAHVDIAGSWADLITPDGRCWGTIKPPLAPSLWDWIIQRSTVHASVMFRRRVKSCARYHEELRFGEDYYFLTALYWKGCVLENIQEPLYKYNVRPKDLLGRSRSKFWQILTAKIAISELFPRSIRGIFLVVNFLNLFWGFIRGLILSITKR